MSTLNAKPASAAESDPMTSGRRAKADELRDFDLVALVIFGMDRFYGALPVGAWNRKLWARWCEESMTCNAMTIP